MSDKATAVTPEMIEAGVNAFLSNEGPTIGDTMMNVYLAMQAASPVGDEVVEKIARSFCREACAEISDPPCYEIDANWMENSDPDVSCNCVSMARAAIAALTNKENR